VLANGQRLKAKGQLKPTAYPFPDTFFHQRTPIDVTLGKTLPSNLEKAIGIILGYREQPCCLGRLNR
jgi:hypothetical protein